VIGAQGSPSPPAGQLPASPRCRITGRVSSGDVPLPGASIVVYAADAARASTSTDIDGTYAILFAPDTTYRIVVELTGFARNERSIPFGAPPCDQAIDVQLALQPRTESPVAGPAAAARTPTPRDASGTPARAAQRFQALSVQADAAGAATLDVAPASEPEEIARLLPPGFSVQAAQSEAIAIVGSNDAASLDRGLLNDRLEAITRGLLDPATGQFAAGFGPGDGGRGGLEGFEGRGGFFDGGRGGRGGGRDGRGDFVLGGRAARAQSPYQGSANYTFGGSALNSPPYQLRSEVPVTQPQFAQNNFGATFGGPLKIPGLYANSNRRTNFQLNYTGNQSSNLFDQYATVPTDAMRAGDFSSSAFQLIDPATGRPFPGNQIPTSRIDPSARSLLQYIPAPNLPGATRNYHVSTTARSSSNGFNLRLTQNLSPNPAQGGRGAGGRGGDGGFGGFGGGRGGGRRGGAAQGRGTSVVLNAQLQYRRNDTQALNVFPNLGGDTTSTSLSAPITLNVSRGRSIQNVNVNLTHASATTTNAFADTRNVAAEAGILYPAGASSEAMNWGVPTLTFSGFTGVRGAAASRRGDNRLNAGYTWIRPLPRHQLRFGGEFRLDRSSNQINSNARGTFTFTGAYSSGGGQTVGRTGADIADFLLGLPHQASLQVGGTSRLRQHSFAAYIEDNWQRSAKLTFNLGLRYELARPYVEADGRLANLDVTPGFTSAVPVVAGGTGPYTGEFPAGLLNTDVTNLGPRLGVAYRLTPRTILRSGYSITYNSGSYASIARELSGQPPFADTETITGTVSAPLTLAEALLSSSSTTTNNWGVDRDFALGMIQTWNAAVTRNVTQDWSLQAGYTGTKGTDLDILRAPNLGAGGVPIAGVQPFIWESSGGHSIMHGGTLQVQRRQANGYRGAFSYTFARSMDNASSLGAGGAVVAQNDKDLASEWGVSSFDRRHQISGNLNVELPWGPNRRWLKDGGTLAGLFGEWSAQVTVTVQSGTPLTARVLGASSDLLRGVNGSLRANYNGGPIQVSNPTIDEFFNITAFSAPGAGQFGNSARNMITGPGSRQLNASFQRDVRLGGTRAITLQVNAVNLLNTVQWAGVDTNVNSPTFGQVLSVRPMRTITISARFRY
jgi:hypothetical protein